MRAGIGLLSVLIAGLIMAYVWTKDVSTTSKALKTVQPQLNQMSGKSSDGTLAKDSAAFSAVERNSTLKGLRVTAVTPGGALGAHYGLAVNDVIIRIGPLQMGETVLSDFDSAKDMVVDGFQRNIDLVVDRGGTEITLPAQRGFIAAPAAGGAGAAPPGVDVVAPGGSDVAIPVGIDTAAPTRRPPPPPNSPQQSARDLVNKIQGGGE